MAAALAALSVAASPSPSPASVTIGQLAPGTNPSTYSVDYDWLQESVTSGSTYAVPGTGTITSWAHNAGNGVGQTLTMKVFRKVADPATYRVVGHDGPRPLATSTLNGFPTNIPVKPGDIVGLNSTSPADTACVFGVPGGDIHLFSTSNLADGGEGAFNQSPSYRINVSAVFVYSNSFTFGETNRNKKKGTATVTVSVPNPGELAVSGKGAKTAGATIAKTVTAAGDVELLIKTSGKSKRKLNDTGKVSIKPTFTYSPSGGDPSTQSKRLTLRKR